MIYLAEIRNARHVSGSPYIQLHMFTLSVIYITVLPTKSDSGVMFCSKSHQEVIIDRSIMYLSYPLDRITTQVISRFEFGQEMFHLTIVNKYHLTVTPSWHDDIYSNLHINSTASLRKMVGRGQVATSIQIALDVG